MTLALDLNDNQAQQVYTLVLKQAEEQQAFRKSRAQYKEEGKRPTKEERLTFYNKQLDAKIAHQRAMKGILNADQFELWRKLSLKRNGKKERKGKQRGPHRRSR